ncbi:MAG: SCO family protein [Geminicoccaceae bacterium]|nr:SCO family protein [Geminicoccaceae bacterium]MCX7630572.1 SCO family protein [Geminicoccaceae bacterium]MDW8124794.1 SCO family protein [Geminicoccaceae bacterium]MDW8340682.1 SCO family protein [Geminicoccaceae bacterium]
MRQRVLFLVLVLLAAVSAAIAAALVARSDRNTQRLGGLTEVQIGGPLNLVHHTGRRFADSELAGKYRLIYFGYTYCPDICPLGLLTMSEALDRLPPPVAQKIQPIFVTVDPERDTPEVLAAYVASFHPRLIGLTGTIEEIEAVKRAYRVFARKSEEKRGEDYLVDHSTFTYLMGPDGRYLAHFGHGTTPEQMAERLVRLVGGT